MGVHGLTTYLREHKSILSHTLQLPHNLQSDSITSPGGDERITVVLDGWSFIYEVVHCADLPWVYGGEYPQLSRVIRQIVDAWIEVGMDLHFVFDGPYPTLKFPTLVSRITQNYVRNGLLFFRTSATARATPRFLHETAMLPPLSYGVCVETLVQLASGAHEGKLHVHIADEEGDPYAVALAGRLNAYVAGRDSDFVVLNAEGYKGYIPLDEMIWTLSQTQPAGWDGEGSIYSVSTEADLDDDGGFKPARTARSRKKRPAAHQRSGQGIIPPVDAPGPDAQLALTFSVYNPATLAAHLEIPVSVLPLLGALVGNDFTGSSDAGAAEVRTSRRANLQRLFFERQLTLGQRIGRVANTLSGLLAAAFGQGATSSKKRGKKQIGSVMELIDAAVTALLLRPLDTFATGEKEAIVERVVEATLQYAIPKPSENGTEGADETTHGVLQWVSDACPLHDVETCPLFISLSRLVPPPSDDALGENTVPAKTVEDPYEIVRAAYITAYRQGQFDPHILDAVQSATVWPRHFLEDPDKECVERSIGRPIRRWMYAILDASVGLPEPPEPEDVEGDGEDSDEDELVDVVEDSDDDVDPLARLRGALKELDESDEEESADQQVSSSVVSTSTALTTSSPKTVTEYVRRGTRLAPEEVPVTRLAELLREHDLECPVYPQTSLPLPPPLWREDLRRKLLLLALESDHPSVAALPDDRIMAVLAVRFIVHRMHLRAQESPGVKERQLERWTQTEARAFLASTSSFIQHEPTADAATEPVRIVERHVQLVAQVSAALEALEQLSHALLLYPRIPSPASFFSGTRFHALLNEMPGVQGAGEVDEEVWRACLEGLENAYTALPQRRGKKEKKARAAEAAAAIPAKGSGKKGAGAKGGMFGLLADAEA
ncbi:hypothetical protein C8Q78DRAFT_1063616 [Trametes maxima]|nr:hypothetical protein C8Q78DRAFT_1063616 [Trametes maxima]